MHRYSPVKWSRTFVWPKVVQNLCRSQKHSKLKLAQSVIKMSCSQKCQVPTGKQTTNPKSRGSILFFCDMGVSRMQVWSEGPYTFMVKEHASSVGSERTLMMYISCAPDFHQSCYKITELQGDWKEQFHIWHHSFRKSIALPQCVHILLHNTYWCTQNCLPVTIGYDCGPGTLAPKSAEVGLLMLAFMSSSPPANDAMAEYSVAWKKNQKTF